MGQQHRLAGLLCCFDIWRQGYRYAVPQVKLCLVVTVHAAERVLITAGVELLGCHVAFAQDLAKRYKVSAGVNAFLSVKQLLHYWVQLCFEFNSDQSPFEMTCRCRALCLIIKTCYNLT